MLLKDEIKLVKNLQAGKKQLEEEIRTAADQVAKGIDVLQFSNINADQLSSQLTLLLLLLVER